jgi:hypothetical protein
VLEAEAILARIDRAIAELQAIKVEIVTSMPVPPAEANGLDADSDFAPTNLVEVPLPPDAMLILPGLALA